MENYLVEFLVEQTCRLEIHLAQLMLDRLVQPLRLKIHQQGKNKRTKGKMEENFLLYKTISFNSRIL
jgi:hypothetical protein